MKAFQKHLSHQFSAGNVHKKQRYFYLGVVFFSPCLLLPAMGNYELLPSVNLSCKNSLQREIHFRSDANPSSKRAGRVGGRRERRLAEHRPYTVPRPQAAVRVGGLLFYFISLESSANLPSLSPILWGPRELLSFDKVERKSAPGYSAFARVPPVSGRGAGARHAAGQGGCGWGVADLWLCRPRGGLTRRLRGAAGKSRSRAEVQFGP